MKIGIIGSMPQEIERISQELDRDRTEVIAGREFHSGRFAGTECVLVFSHWGKVAAAMTATILIEKFKVETIVFTGVAGAVSPMLEIGDVVIADKLIQHDFDISAAGELAKLEIPFLGISYFPVNAALIELGRNAARRFLEGPNHLLTPAVKRRGDLYIGTIASGDQFIAHAAKLEELRAAIPELLAIEMEGAAVAQVCNEYHVPCLVIRTISDKADHSASIDFLRFVKEVASDYSFGIISNLVQSM